VTNTVVQLITAGALLFGTFQVTASDRMVDGKTAYEAMCASCHDKGKSGAPVIRNTSDWQNRSHLWDAVLVEHADKGYLNMPARGGTDIATQYDVQAAAEYMLSITHPDLPRD
jgi:cytochrome c5